VDRLWQMFLRRFDPKHTVRFFKQTLGWTKPRIRTPAAADRWSRNAQRAPRHNPGKTIKTDTAVKGGKKQAA
jgi:hypothetical protein